MSILLSVLLFKLFVVANFEPPQQLFFYENTTDVIINDFPDPISDENEAFYSIYINGINKTSDILSDRRMNSDDAVELAFLYLTDRGYFNASFDSTNSSNNEKKLYFTSDNRFYLNEVKWVTNSDTLISPISEYFDTKLVDNLINDIIGNLVQGGYPLSEANLLIFNIDGDNYSIELTYEIHPGELVVIFGLTFSGLNQLTSEYLTRESRFKDGVIYNSRTHETYLRNLRNSTFITSVDGPELRLIDSEWFLHFDVEELRSSHVDVVVGYNPTTTESYNVVGTGELFLNNLIAEGTIAHLIFERYPFGDSSLEAGYEHHWLFNIPLAAGVNLNLYQRDTTYFQQKYASNIDYYLGGGYKIGIDLTTSRTRRDMRVVNPGVSDNDVAAFGFNLSFSSLDRTLSPRSGLFYRIGSTRGVKTLKKSDADAQLKTRYPFSTASAYLRLYQMISPRTVLTPRISGAFRYSDIHFDDDLFRIGGANSIRGYREQQFRVTNYAWSDLELRYFVSDYSYFFAFGAVGIYDRPEQVGSENPDRISDIIYSGGIGLSYRVRLGMLHFSYALSPEDRLTNGKVHFGVSSRF